MSRPRRLLVGVLAGLAGPGCSARFIDERPPVVRGIAADLAPSPDLAQPLDLAGADLAGVDLVPLLHPDLVLP